MLLSMGSLFSLSGYLWCSYSFFRNHANAHARLLFGVLFYKHWCSISLTMCHPLTQGFSLPMPIISLGELVSSRTPAVCRNFRLVSRAFSYVPFSIILLLFNGAHMSFFCLFCILIDMPNNLVFGLAYNISRHYF